MGRIVLLYYSIKSNSLQAFINKCLRRILCILLPVVVTNENLWKLAKEEPVATAIKRGKWKWI
jgi:hypothetical protein